MRMKRDTDLEAVVRKKYTAIAEVLDERAGCGRLRNRARSDTGVTR